MDWPFDHLRMFGYDVLVIDWPWDFENYSEAGTAKGPDPHYDVMPLSDIPNYPMDLLAKGDALYLIWLPAWIAPGDVQNILNTWKLTFRSMMAWRKTTRKGKVRWGTGYRVRSLHENIVVATIGNPQHKPFPSLFDGLAREHSRKPDEFYRLVDKHCPGSFKVDIFSRTARPGWDNWGKERYKFNSVETENTPGNISTNRPTVIVPPEEFGGLFQLGACHGTSEGVEEQA